MSINIPKSAKEVTQRAKTDVKRELTGSNPELKNSWLFALVTSYSNRVYDFYLSLQQAIKQTFWDTSTGTFLANQASWFGVTRLAATRSTGNIVITGTALSNIPIRTLLQTSGGLQYKTNAAAVIIATSLSVSSITRAGTVATVTTAGDHGLSSFVPVTIAGADLAGYNGAQSIQVTGLTTFTYTVAGSPATPAAGTITAAFTAVNIAVNSEAFGVANNLALDGEITLQSPIAGVDDSAYVDFGEISGGTAQEDESVFRTRFLDRVQNPVAMFNDAAITAKAKEINGVTRVFIQQITPSYGQVTIFFMRDSQENPIPTSSEVSAVKASILTIKPAHTSDNDVIVTSPTAVPVAFTFSALSPETATMKTAIENSLKHFFKESTQVGVNVDQDAYRSAVFNTIDTVTGARVLSFALSEPTADISVSAGQIGTLGAVTYS